MHVAIRRRHSRRRVDQFLPAFPIANADLADQKFVIADVFLATKRVTVPLRRIEDRDVRSGVDDDDFFRRHTCRFDHHPPDLLANRDDAIDTLAAELSAIPQVKRK